VNKDWLGRWQATIKGPVLQLAKLGLAILKVRLEMDWQRTVSGKEENKVRTSLGDDEDRTGPTDQWL
jgi:hypothetical protein